MLGSHHTQVQFILRQILNMQIIPTKSIMDPAQVKSRFVRGSIDLDGFCRSPGLSPIKMYKIEIQGTIIIGGIEKLGREWKTTTLIETSEQFDNNSLISVFDWNVNAMSILTDFLANPILILGCAVLVVSTTLEWRIGHERAYHLTQ